MIYPNYINKSKYIENYNDVVPGNLQNEINEQNQITLLVEKVNIKNHVIKILEEQLKELELKKPKKIINFQYMSQYLNYNIEKTNLELKISEEKDLRGNLFAKYLLLKDKCYDENHTLTYDREKVSYVNLESMGLNEIYSLRYFPNLEEIRLYDNYITDFQGIKELTGNSKLTEMNLMGNKINDLNGFDNFKNLKKLDLSWNKISKIEALDNLKKLESLDLGNNSISVLEGLDNIKKMYSFRISLDKLESSKYTFEDLKNKFEVFNSISFDTTNNRKELNDNKDKITKLNKKSFVKELIQKEKINNQQNSNNINFEF